MADQLLLPCIPSSPPPEAQRLVLGYGRIPTPSVGPAVAALAAALETARTGC